MPDILRIVVQVPPPPYEGEELPPPQPAPAAPAKLSSLRIGGESN